MFCFSTLLHYVAVVVSELWISIFSFLVTPVMHFKIEFNKMYPILKPCD